jgi:cell division protein ZapD
MTSSNNLCSFDMPGLYFWLHQNNNLQQEQFEQWLEKLSPIKNSIQLILQLIRESSTFTKQIANCGFYQAAFKHNTSYQIIRIKLPSTAAVFPEISGNKHRITVRMLSFSSSSTRPQQTKENIDFELSCCHL